MEIGGVEDRRESALLDARNTIEPGGIGKAGSFAVTDVRLFKVLMFRFEQPAFTWKWFELRTAVSVAAVEFFGELSE
jgi:hypothetical protein